MEYVSQEWFNPLTSSDSQYDLSLISEAQPLFTLCVRQSSPKDTPPARADSRRSGANMFSLSCAGGSTMNFTHICTNSEKLYGRRGLGHLVIHHNSRRRTQIFYKRTNYYAAYADSHSLKNCGISAHEGQHYLKSSSRPFKRWLAIYGLKKGQKLRKLRPLILVRSLASLETHQHENWTPIGLSGR
ncbi:predicted protein [Histoplasma capsulatum H143]|uniref:Uncharacterized protein n=1 Tax=Ajellomyces capsulatus (strain H143) TaxID=544712 RepID=C6HFT3_AJECH|nr:predicted protein [Histoplasma capsulatum H143]